MRCIICESNDWQDVDQYRVKPSGMSICKCCGMISYPKKYKSKEEILRYYKKDYRKNPPTSDHIFTGVRKLNYHEKFLMEFFSQWREKKEFVVFECGSAFGMFLDWLKRNLPNSSVYGSEWDLSSRRVAWHEYGIELGLDLDDSKKHDLICSYKVLEHQLDADLELMRYRAALKDDGLLYLSVPTWFKELSDFGRPGFDGGEYYYSPDHINTWRQEHVEFLFKKVGFEIIKFDDKMYNETYLLKKCEPIPCEPPKLYEENLENLKKVKQVIDAMEIADFKSILKIWPNAPWAWSSYYQLNRADLHGPNGDGKLKAFVEEFEKSCPNSVQMLTFVADLNMKYNHYETAIKYFNSALEVSPNNAQILLAISKCIRFHAEKAAPDDKVNLLKESRSIADFVKRISIKDFQEAASWSFYDASLIPMPNESSN